MHCSRGGLSSQSYSRSAIAFSAIFGLADRTPWNLTRRSNVVLIGLHFPFPHVLYFLCKKTPRPFTIWTMLHGAQLEQGCNVGVLNGLAQIQSSREFAMIFWHSRGKCIYTSSHWWNNWCEQIFRLLEWRFVCMRLCKSSRPALSGSRALAHTGILDIQIQCLARALTQEYRYQRNL